MKDAQLIVTKALPAAAANNNTDSIDIKGGTSNVDVPAGVHVECVIPALANLADTKKVTIHIEESDDDSTWSDVDPLGQTTVTGAGGAGSSAKTVDFALPPTLKRYVRFNQAVDSAGGDNTASSITYNVKTNHAD